MTTSPLSDFLDRAAQLVGGEFVSVEPALLAEASTATFATSQRVAAAVRPATTAEVQALARLATEHRVPIYPVSSGKNWGYGSRVPYRDGSVILDLSRLDRIRAYDETLAYVQVEAGVTQRQLCDFLAAQGSPHFLAVTSSSPDSSLVGNTVERGNARGVFVERISDACAFEVVTATGELLHTGFDRFAGARAASLHRWGVGPVLDGLFSQSNLGIVTAMTLWLHRRPASWQTFFFQPRDPARLAPLVERLRTVMLDNGFASLMALSNDYSILSYLHQYPWAEAGGATPLPEALRQDLGRKSKLAPINGTGMVLAPSEAAGRALRRVIRRALAPELAYFVVVDGWRARLYRALSRPWSWVTGVDPREFLDFAYFKNPGLGNLDEKTAIPMVYWRKRRPAGTALDPDRDRCGLLWLAPVVPFLGHAVAEVVALIDQVTAAHGFEPNWGARFTAARSVEIIAGVIYDRETPGEDDKARRCYEDLLSRLVAGGYYPNRLGVQSAGLLPASRDDFDQVLARLKQALDPEGILAPGR